MQLLILGGDELRRIYERISSAVSNSSRNAKFDFIKNDFHKSFIILDDGAGVGDFIYDFVKNTETNDKVFIAIDIRLEYLKRLKERFPYVHVIVGNATKLPFRSGTIDFLVSNAVLEHIPPGATQRYCLEIRRVAKIAFVATPYKYSLFEAHYKLPFIGWFSERFMNRIVRFCGKELHNDPVNLLNRTEVKKFFPGSTIRLIPAAWGLFMNICVICKPKSGNHRDEKK